MTSPSSALEANLRTSAQATIDFLVGTAQLAIFESAVNEVINRYKNRGDYILAPISRRVDSEKMI
tara:strand:- start:462 stop:656 length:195 start_codon:yes stop_codon:yes gene_type:complete